MADQKISDDPEIASPTTSARLAGIDIGTNPALNYRFTPAATKSWLATGAADLSATGTRNSTTYLRGDNTWGTPAGGGGSYAAQATIAYASTMGTNAATSQNFALGPLTGNGTLANPTNLVAGMTLVWRIRQDGTGSRTLAFGSMFKFRYGIVPGLTPTANATDILTAYYDGTDLHAVMSSDHR